MLPISGHIQHFAQNVTPNFAPNIAPAAVAATAASNRPYADSHHVAVCVDALSRYLDSPLAIDGLHGVTGSRPDNDLQTLTHLMFYRLQEKSQQSVMIHLIRNQNHLMVDVVELPGNDPMDLLFRAAATAAQAARDWRGETPAASDAHTHALRLSVERTCGVAAPAPGQPSSGAADQGQALFQAITTALETLENYNGNQTRRDADPDAAADEISWQWPHTTSPVVPLLPLPSISASDTGTASRRGTKRPHRDDTGAINSAAEAASAAIVPAKLLHADISGAHPTPP